MSFLLVDQITQFNSGKSVQGVKHISASEPYLCYSYQSQRPIFMPTLVGEAVGQLAAWAVIDALDFSKRPVAGIVSQVNIYDEVAVGDTLKLSADIDAIDEQAVEYHGVASVGDKKIFEIESAVGPMMPMSEMNDKAEVQAQFNQIHRVGAMTENTLDNTSYDLFPGVEHPSKLNPAGCFDRILVMQQDELCIAEKIVSLSAPYFVDHFPLKPVLPLTILLNCKMSFAQLYLSRYYPQQSFKVCCARKIKMSQFVSPGSVVKSQMKAKLKANQIVFQFKSYVQAQRVCVCEVVFEREE